MGSVDAVTSEDPHRARALELFERIQREFPRLEMNLDPDSEHVELDLDIPAQPGLCFAVNLNLQNEDELHLSACELWLQWFPSSDPMMEREFFDAVVGLLSGHYRIVEELRGRRVVHAELQKPIAEGWETVGKTSAPLFPIPWRKSSRVIQNDQAMHSTTKTENS